MTADDAMRDSRDWRRDADALVRAEEDWDDGASVITQLEALCLALRKNFDASGAAVSLISAADFRGVIAGSDESSMRIDEMQYTAGEGPCYEASAAQQPVLVSDVRAAQERWPGYVTAVVAAGVGAAFTFPVGMDGLAILSLYASEPRRLTVNEHALAVGFAEVATRILAASGGSDIAAVPSARTMARDTGDRQPWELTVANHAQVYQAQGMLMVDLDVSLTEALALMRARAFAADMNLPDFAQEVVDGRARVAGDDA